MNVHKLKPIGVVLAAVSLLTLGACDQRNSNESVGQKLDRATDKVAATADTATTKTAEALDDTAITTKVKAAIVAEPGLRSLQINVDTKDAVVTLSGSVDSPTLKGRVEQLAANVAGVRSVTDNLVIKPT